MKYDIVKLLLKCIDPHQVQVDQFRIIVGHPRQHTSDIRSHLHRCTTDFAMLDKTSLWDPSWYLLSPSYKII